MKSQENQQPVISRQSIQILLQDKVLEQAAKNDWQKFNMRQNYLTPLCIKKDLDQEIKWFKSKIVELLNNYVKITRVSAYSKQWQNKEIVEAKKRQANNKKRLSGNDDRKQKLKKLVTLTIKLSGKQNGYVGKISYKKKKKTVRNKVRSQTKTDAGPLSNISNYFNLKPHRHLRTLMKMLPPL